MSWSAAPPAAMLNVPFRRWRKATPGPHTPAAVTGGPADVRATVARIRRWGRATPAVAWSGTLASREQAAQKSGPRLVEPA